jgi:hypothetical protein
MPWVMIECLAFARWRQASDRGELAPSPPLPGAHEERSTDSELDGAEKWAPSPAWDVLLSQVGMLCALGKRDEREREREHHAR